MDELEKFESGLATGELTPEELEQFEIKAAADEKRLSSLEGDSEAQPSKDGQTQQSNTQEPATAAPQVDTEPNPGPPSIAEQQINSINETANQPEKEQDQQYVWDEGYDMGDFARNTAEGVLAVPAGMVDFGVDLINKIPGVNIPKIPEFDNGVAASIRDVGNVIFGTYLATRFLRGGRGAIASKVPIVGNVKVGKTFLKTDPVVRFMGRTAEAAGGGYIADSIVQFNEEDDNLAAMLKTNMPAWVANRIPMDWTTIGVTNPDIIRERNRNEGLFLGVFGDALLGFARAVRAGSDLARFTKNMDNTFARAEFIAKDPNKSINDVLKETGGRNKELMLEGPDDVEPPGAKTIRTQNEALDELGKAALKNDPDALNRPTKGVHDLFDDLESGVRTVDEGGIFGALTNVAQIKKNIGTFKGRVGSVISEARLRYGQISKGIAPTQEIIGAFAKQLSDIGDFYAIIPGIKNVKLDSSVINTLNRESTAEAIGQALSDKSMGVEQIFSMLDPFRVDGNIDVLKNPNLSEGIDIAIRNMSEEYIGANRAIASNAVQQSLAGQAADMAEASRLAGKSTGAVDSVNNQVLERLVYLMTERGMMGYRWGATGAVLRVRNGVVKAGNKTAKVKEIIQDLTAKEVELFEQNKKYVQTLGAISATKPEFLKPYMLANEMTGGNVNSIQRLNEYMRNNLGVLNKALVDNNPEMPSQLVQGMWSNIYNSVLSAFATPIRALVGNAGGLIAKPVTILGGAALSGDVKTIQDGWIAMGSVFDSMRKGYDYMGEIFTKVSQDPYYVQDLTRSDLAKTQLRDENLEILETYAAAAAKEGEMGPSILLQQAKTLDDLANHPWLRFGANAMTALDGFTRAVIANGELRYKAIAELRDEGLPVTAETVSQKANKYWNLERKNNFQSSAVEKQTREIALNADSEISSKISGIVARVPALRPLIMFPTTSVNMIGMMAQYSPIRPFAKDVNEITGQPIRNLTIDMMREKLVTRELADASTPAEEVLNRYKRLRAEIKGKQAVGTLAVGAGTAAFMSDRITGDGVYEENVNRNEEELRIPRRSVQLTDDTWISYDGLGPVSDWIALVVTIAENGTMLGDTATANFLNKAGFILASSVTERSVLSNVEPLLGIMNGNGASIAKLSAGVANSMIPLAGQRSEWGRWIGEGTKETQKEFLDYMRNRNKFISDLPDQYDWLYGKKVGTQESWFVNAWNAVSPFKVSSGPRPEAAFLAEIEFDARPGLTTDGKGNAYPPEIQSKVAKLMAENEVFLDAVRREMKYAEEVGFFENIKKARAQGIGKDVIDLTHYEGMRDRLVRALNSSKRIAINELDRPSKYLLQELEMRQNIQERANKLGGSLKDGNFDELLTYPK